MNIGLGFLVTGRRSVESQVEVQVQLDWEIMVITLSLSEMSRCRRYCSSHTAGDAIDAAIDGKRAGAGDCLKFQRLFK